MPDAPRIVIADRSELAANMYRLLLTPLGAQLIIRRRFEEARPHFFRRETVALGIFNSNVFGRKFDEVVARMLEGEAIRKASKIFLCRASPAESEWRERLAKLPGAEVVVRPFHPDEFLSIVARRIRGEGA